METPSFTLNLEVDDLKPLPYVLPRNRRTQKRMKVYLMDAYPKHDEEFFKTLTSCSDRISKLKSAELRHRYNHDLTRIFAKRDFKAIMRLYMELIRVQLGEPLEQAPESKH